MGWRFAMATDASRAPNRRPANAVSEALALLQQVTPLLLERGTDAQAGWVWATCPGTQTQA